MPTTLGRFVYRRKTAAQWTLENEVLLAAEPGIETDTGLWKLGDGTTGWTGLPYQPSNAANAATYTPLTDVRALAYIDFTTKSNGAAPARLDTGQTVTTTANGSGTGTIVGGRLVAGGPFTSSSYADYYQWSLGSNGKRIGAVWTQPAGSNDGNGTVTVALWNAAFQGSGHPVPEGPCHLVIIPGTGTTGAWKFYVIDHANRLIVVKQGTFTNPPADGVTPWTVDVLIDTDPVIGVAYVTLPDNSTVTVTDTDIAASIAALATALTDPSYVAVTLAELGASVAMIEHFANVSGNTAVYGGFKSAWAEAALPPRSRRFVNQRELAKLLTSVKRLIPAAPVITRYMPATLTTATAGTSTTNVDGTNGKVTAVYGNTGGLLLEIDAYYEFTRGADTVFWRVAGSGGAVGNTPTQAAMVGTSGQKTLVHHVITVTGGTPGGACTYTLQHSTVSGFADLKMGGSGGTMCPPLVIKATPI